MAKTDTEQYDVLVIDKKTKRVTRKLGPMSLEAAQKRAVGNDIDTANQRTAIAVHEIRPGETIPIDPKAPPLDDEAKAKLAAAQERKGIKPTKEKTSGSRKKD